MDCPPYALIAGHGRSGTNWLLEMLDLSERTFCRNEPYGLSGSPLADLTADRFVRRVDQKQLQEHWESAVGWTARHMGRRDRQITMPKRHMRPLSRTLGLYRLVRGPRYRSVLRVALPSLRGEEWRLPIAIFDKGELEKALAVLKLVGSPGWVDFVLRRRTGVPVFHILRHPGGYLNSWSNRYRATRDDQTIHQENRSRLEDVAREEPAWGTRFGDIGAMTTEESELWYWCYAAETIEAAAAGNPRCLTIIYEHLAADAVTIVRKCYEHAGLPFTDVLADRVAVASRNSGEIAGSWRSRLSPAQVDLATRVLRGSTLRHWWPEDDA